jgi:hypothetical protein
LEAEKRKKSPFAGLGKKGSRNIDAGVSFLPLGNLQTPFGISESAAYIS